MFVRSVESMPFTKAWNVLERGVTEGAFPGAVAVIANRTDIIASISVGNAVVEPRPTPMRSDMIFDVASLTKVVSLLPGLLLLVEAGQLSLDEPIARFFPSWRGEQKSGVTLRQLLTHTSGLPAWHPTYAHLDPKVPDHPSSASEGNPTDH